MSEYASVYYIYALSWLNVNYQSIFCKYFNINSVEILSKLFSCYISSYYPEMRSIIANLLIIINRSDVMRTVNQGSMSFIFILPLKQIEFFRGFYSCIIAEDKCVIIRKWYVLQVQYIIGENK